MNSYTNYVILGFEGEACIGHASTRNVKMAASLAQTMKNIYQLRLEITWCFYQQTAVPGEQGSISFDELVLRATSDGQAPA